MEKIIELLNEYEGNKLYFYDDGIYCDKYDMYEVGDNLVELEIISKKYGFIKWLVDNDKIGRNKNSDRSAMIDLMRAEVKEGTGVFEGTEKYEWYIMLLSIQDNPIEFLISILK